MELVPASRRDVQRAMEREGKKKEREREENTRGTCVLQRRDLENKIVLQTRSAFVLYIIDRSATSDRPWENAKGVFGSFGKRPTTGETRQGWEKLVRLVYICMYQRKGSPTPPRCTRVITKPDTDGLLFHETACGDAS